MPEDFSAVELLEKARRTGASADAVAALTAMRRADEHQPLDDFRVLFPMAEGRLDNAFAQPDTKGMEQKEPELLTLAFTAPIRRDPRFWPIAARAGLVRYWRTTNKWPDFCSDPSYPLDCRAQARRVLSTKER